MDASSENVESSAASTGSPDQDELARLRAQVADLQTQLAVTQKDAGQAAPSRPRRKAGDIWRPIVCSLLIFIAAVLAPLSVVATWAHDEVANTDRYVQTVTPLASEPAVQNAIADRITTEIFNRVDVAAITQQAVQALSQTGLPPTAVTTLQALSVPAANGIKGFVSDQVNKLVRSPQFADAWVAANRAAHTQMVAVLTGQGTKSVQIRGDAVQLNLAPLVNTLKQRLEQRGFGLASKIPTVNATFTVFQSSGITKAQSAFHFLQTAARVLPILALILVAVAVGVARSHRRALVGAGLAIAVSMLLLGLALNIFRAVYLNAVPASVLPPDAAGAIYDQLVGFIRLNLRAILVVALAVAAGAWLTGPSAAAVATRKGITAGTASLRSGSERAGLNTGPFGAWVYRYRTALRAATIGIAALVYVLAAHPTGAFSLWVLVFTVLVLFVIEFLARPPAAEPRGDGTATADAAELPAQRSEPADDAGDAEDTKPVTTAPK